MQLDLPGLQQALSETMIFCCRIYHGLLIALQHLPVGAQNKVHCC